MSDGENASSMDPRRFEELKEAYALNTLSEEERLAFERYLAENPSERPEVEELSSIAALLALAPQEQEPPAGLRQSVMSQVRSEANEADSGERRGETAVSSRGHRGGWTRRLFGVRGVVTTAAAAAIIALAAWNVSLQSEVSDLRDTKMSSFELQGSGQAESVQGELVSLGDERAIMVATDLPELPEDQTYEMWAIDEGEEPEPIGLFETRDGSAIKTTEQPVSGADTFAVTVEPEEGSDQPTSDPVITADLTSRT
ncbi:anti-sigma factor [soil metagenome]